MQEGAWKNFFKKFFLIGTQTDKYCLDFTTGVG